MVLSRELLHYPHERVNAHRFDQGLAQSIGQFCNDLIYATLFKHKSLQIWVGVKFTTTSSVWILVRMSLTGGYLRSTLSRQPYHLPPSSTALSITTFG